MESGESAALDINDLREGKVADEKLFGQLKAYYELYTEEQNKSIVKYEKKFREYSRVSTYYIYIILFHANIFELTLRCHCSAELLEGGGRGGGAEDVFCYHTLHAVTSLYAMHLLALFYATSQRKATISYSTLVRSHSRYF